MKKFLGILGRALYQIIVVGIICLPYRLIVLAGTLCNVLMLPVQGVSIIDGLAVVFYQMAAAYKARAHWVKTGETTDLMTIS